MGKANVLEKELTEVDSQDGGGGIGSSIAGGRVGRRRRCYEGGFVP